MANSYGWNDDRRPYGGDDYDQEPRRGVYRRDRDDFGSSGPYDPTARTEGRSYVRDEGRYGDNRDHRASGQHPADRNRPVDQSRDRDYGRRNEGRPVSDLAYGLGGGWDYEMTGAYLVADDGRFEQGRHDRDRSRRFGPGSPELSPKAERSAARSQEHRGRGPKDYTRSDERIREDVNDHLTDDPQLDASGVTVSVKSGEVTLAGTVQERGDKRRAEDLAERISGVRHVQNNLRVHDSNYNAATATAGSSLQPSPSGGAGRSSLS